MTTPRSEVRLIAPEAARRVPWRNGRGTTRELAIWPPGSELARSDFEWRLAQARVSEPGPFSDFAGYERLLVVVEGAGLVLEHGQAAPRQAARLLEPCQFPGDLVTTALLPQGPIEDLNLLYRPRSVRAQMETVRLGMRSARSPLALGHTLVYAPTQALVVRIPGEEQAFELPARGLLWACPSRARAQAPEEFELRGADALAAAVIVRIEALASGEPAA